MVFNVIAFASTLFAFFYGTAFNNLYRNVADLDRKNIHTMRNWVLKIVAKTKGKCRKSDEPAAQEESLIDDTE